MIREHAGLVLAIYNYTMAATENHLTNNANNQYAYDS